MSAGSSLFSWERVSLAKCVFSQILWIGTLFKKREDARSTSCVFHLCIYRHYSIKDPPKSVFFYVLCGFLLRLSSLYFYLSAEFQTHLSKRIKSWSSLIQFQKYLDSAMVFFTLTMDLKQKKRWWSRSKPWGFYCPGIAAISPASSRSAPVVNALLMFTKACVDGRLW